MNVYITITLLILGIGFADQPTIAATATEPSGATSMTVLASVQDDSHALITNTNSILKAYISNQVAGSAELRIGTTNEVHPQGIPYFQLNVYSDSNGPTVSYQIYNGASRMTSSVYFPNANTYNTSPQNTYPTNSATNIYVFQGDVIYGKLSNPVTAISTATPTPVPNTQTVPVISSGGGGGSGGGGSSSKKKSAAKSSVKKPATKKKSAKKRK